MVIKNFYILIINFIFFFKPVYSSQIYDFQTESFIENINTQILSVNSYDKKIKFKIYNNDFPNAFVTESNIIYLSSGLITKL